MNKAFEKIAYAIIDLFVRMLGFIPKKLGTRVGSLLGRILFIVDGRHRKIAMQNLAYAFQDEKDIFEVKKHAKKVFENLGKILFEVCWSWNLDDNKLFKHFKIEGLSNIKNAYEKGRGVLVLTAHFGNWELLTVVGAMTGYPLSIVYRPLDFKPLDRFVRNFRTRFGATLIHRRKSFRKILRSLEQGGKVSILLDQSVDWYEGVFVDFFGHRTCTNKGMALLALKTEAPVVPVFLVREDSGFTAKFLPEIPLMKTGDKTKDVEINTEKYNKIIENIVRRYPEQWFWVHRRWKVRPYHPWPRQ